MGLRAELVQRLPGLDRHTIGLVANEDGLRFQHAHRHAETASKASHELLVHNNINCVHKPSLLPRLQSEQHPFLLYNTPNPKNLNEALRAI